jgi:hypothetical protein
MAGEKKDDIPTDPKQAVDAFPLWLVRAASYGPLILILDALSQIEDRDNAPDLGWLPWSFSPNIRLIVSTLPGRSFDGLKKRNWSKITMGLMERAEQERSIREYLPKYRNTLESSRIEKIIAAPQTRNPLYLRTQDGRMGVLLRDSHKGEQCRAQTRDTLQTAMPAAP